MRNVGLGDHDLATRWMMYAVGVDEEALFR
jgi:hypothetical protein